MTTPNYCRCGRMIVTAGGTCGRRECFQADPIPVPPMTTSNPPVGDPEVIFLQPACCADEYNGRQWCKDDQWEPCEDGVQPAKYVRADRCASAEAERDTALREAEQWKLRAEAETLRADGLASERDELRAALIDSSDEVQAALLQLSAARKVLEEIAKEAAAHAAGDLHGTWLDGLETVEKIARQALQKDPMP